MDLISLICFEQHVCIQYDSGGILHEVLEFWEQEISITCGWSFWSFPKMGVHCACIRSNVDLWNSTIYRYKWYRDTLMIHHIVIYCISIFWCMFDESDAQLIGLLLLWRRIIQYGGLFNKVWEFLAGDIMSPPTCVVWVFDLFSWRSECVGLPSELVSLIVLIIWAQTEIRRFWRAKVLVYKYLCIPPEICSDWVLPWSFAIASWLVIRKAWCNSWETFGKKAICAMWCSRA